MKGTSDRNPKPALRNYQLVSLGSNNNVQSIIESMNSDADQGSAEKQILRSPLLKGTDLKNKPATARSQIREKSHKSQTGGVLNSISGEKNHSSATVKEEDSVLVIPVVPSRKKDLTKTTLSVAEFVKDVETDRVGSSELHGTDDECLSRVHNGNVMESVGDADNSGGSGNRHKVEKNAKGQGQRSSSSDNNEDDDDDSETMSSAEESSEELESSSSSGDDEKVNGGGGLDPISEEKSLRIDLPDSGGGGGSVAGGSKRMNRDKIIERLDVIGVEDVDEDDDDDDGKLKTFNRFSKSQ